MSTFASRIFKSRSQGLVFAPLCILFMAAGSAQAYDNHGLFSVEDYYYKDSSSGYKTHFLTTRFKLDTTKLGTEGRYAFHFDGSDREDLGTSGSSTTVKRTRLNLLNVDYKGKDFYLAAGRLWPKEIPFELVDGVNGTYQVTPEYGAGAFGGFKPDVYSMGFSTDYTTAGVYGFFSRDLTTASLAYVYNGYEGGLDRQYIYGQANLGISNTLNIYGTATTDISPSGSLSFTNGVLEANYRPDFTRSVYVGYNQFRSYTLYRSQTSAVDESRQNAYYLGGNYRIADRYNLYGRVERQLRRVTSDGTNTNVNSYQAGFNVDNLMNSAVNMDLNFNTYSGGGSSHKAYRVEFSRLNWEILQLMVRSSYTQNKYDGTDPENIFAFGFSGYLYYKKTWNFSFNYDREEGNTFSSNNVLTRVSYRF